MTKDSEIVNKYKIAIDILTKNDLLVEVCGEFKIKNCKSYNQIIACNTIDELYGFAKGLLTAKNLFIVS